MEVGRSLVVFTQVPRTMISTIEDLTFNSNSYIESDHHLMISTGTISEHRMQNFSLKARFNRV